MTSTPDIVSHMTPSRFSWPNLSTRAIWLLMIAGCAAIWTGAVAALSVFCGYLLHFVVSTPVALVGGLGVAIWLGFGAGWLLRGVR